MNARMPAAQGEMMLAQCLTLIPFATVTCSAIALSQTAVLIFGSTAWASSPHLLRTRVASAVGVDSQQVRPTEITATSALAVEMGNGIAKTTPAS